MLRLPVPVIATSVVGLPVLFAVYLRRIGLSRSVPGRYLALGAFLALGMGVGWALVAGPIVSDAYTAALGGQMDAEQLLLCGVIIPLTYGLAMVVPATAVRMLIRSPGESLDGFAVGAVGAVVVNAAATATLLAPQVAMGEFNATQSVDGLVAQALIEGVAWPLGSVATGGVFGLALWFMPRVDGSRWYRRTVVVPAALLGAVAFSVAMGVVDLAPVPLGVYIALQLLIALGAVLAVRIVIADALLHEMCRETGDAQLRCAECDHCVARMPFCSSCGVAIPARSRSSAEVTALSAAASPPRRATYLNVLGPVTAGVGIAAGAVMLAGTFLKPVPAAFVCPPDCGRPTLGTPVETNPRFSGDDGAFSVSFPGEGTAYEVTLDPPGMKGVRAKYVAGDTGVLNLFGEAARGRTAEQIVQENLKSTFPGAVVDYEIPNASVGYEPGYGVIADVYLRDSSSAFTRLRVIVMAAVKHDYALIATAAGPYHQFSPDYGTGHPSGANLEVAMDMGKYVNSFRWFGDRYRRPS